MRLLGPAVTSLVCCSSTAADAHPRGQPLGILLYLQKSRVASVVGYMQVRTMESEMTALRKQVTGLAAPNATKPEP